MKLLRQYIKKLILEDLGQQVWAPLAPHHSRHYGTERNTKREQDLFYVFQDYLTDNDQRMSKQDIKDIIRYTKDPKYNDVFVKHTRGGALYRGMILPRKDVERLFPLREIPGPDFQHTDGHDFSDPIRMNFTYSPKLFHRTGEISSWTHSYDVAESFALDTYGEVHKGPVAHIIFISDASLGTFIDIGPLYQYRGLEMHSEEEEILALSGVQVSAIQVWDPRWPDAKAEIDARWSNYSEEDIELMKSIGYIDEDGNII